MFVPLLQVAGMGRRNIDLTSSFLHKVATLQTCTPIFALDSSKPYHHTKQWPLAKIWVPFVKTNLITRGVFFFFYFSLSPLCFYSIKYFIYMYMYMYTLHCLAFYSYVHKQINRQFYQNFLDAFLLFIGGAIVADGKVQPCFHWSLEAYATLEG